MRTFKNHIAPIVLVLLLLTASTPTFADWEHIPGQLTVDILQIPTVLVAADKYHLVYELRLTNYHSSPITLKSLSVQDINKNEPIASYAKQRLAHLIHAIGVAKIEKNLLILQSGQAKMIFMWLSFSNKESVPNKLTHQIIFDTKRKNINLTLTTHTDALTISKTLPLVISPPLSGDYWVAGNAPSNTSGHRQANLVIDGHDYFAQRYAIDFIQIGKDGISYKGDETKNESYYCYGKDVLAVASGKVVEVKDDLSENIPHSGKFAVPIDIDTVGGNYVVIDMGHSHYACFAHMIPGSIKVKIGDNVKRGQLIGKVGNSGNSTEPHLHFHVVDKPSFLAANSIPYAFDHFYLRHSKLISDDPLFKAQILDDILTAKTNQLVLENAVVKF